MSVDEPLNAEPGSMSDNEVLELARELYRLLKVTPRWSAVNDDLIRAWGRVCLEMNQRGILDTVTEGRKPGEDTVRQITGIDWGYAR